MFISVSAFPMSTRSIFLNRDLSVENLQFLSSEQALADLAYFIQYAKHKYKLLSKDQKLITFGGSYPGKFFFY